MRDIVALLILSVSLILGAVSCNSESATNQPSKVSEIPNNQTPLETNREQRVNQTPESSETPENHNSSVTEPDERLQKFSRRKINTRGKSCTYAYGYDRTIVYKDTGCIFRLTPIGEGAFRVEYKNKNDALSILCFPPDKPTERDLKTDSDIRPWHDSNVQFSNCLEVSRNQRKEAEEAALYKMKLIGNGDGVDIMLVSRMPGFFTITFN